MFCIATFAAAFAGPASSCLRPAAYTLSTARTTCPLAFDDQPETLTQHVEHLQVEAARLSAATGVAVPQQCVDDVCLEMSAYVELLESTVATLQAEGGLPKATNPTGVYIEKLQAKIALLCADLDMAVPPQCVGDECLEDSAYVELLQTTAETLEARWRVSESDDETLTAYVSRLEATAAKLSDMNGVAVPQQCVGHACLEMGAYVELLESTVATLSGPPRLSSSDGTASAPPPPPPSLTMGAYVEKLEAEAAALSEELGVAAPAQCDGDACLDLQSYVLLLTSHVASLEAQRDA